MLITNIFGAIMGLLIGILAPSPISYFGWFLFVVTVIGALAAASLASTKAEEQKSRDIKSCPHCAEDIKLAAVKCKHCGEVVA